MPHVGQDQYPVAESVDMFKHTIHALIKPQPTSFGDSTKSTFKLQLVDLSSGSRYKTITRNKK